MGVSITGLSATPPLVFDLETVLRIVRSEAPRPAVSDEPAERKLTDDEGLASSLFIENYLHHINAGIKDVPI